VILEQNININFYEDILENMKLFYGVEWDSHMQVALGNFLESDWKVKGENLVLSPVGIIWLHSILF